MNGELLRVLDHIEREKGIAREVLIAAVEAALVSAAKKSIGEKEAEISVKMDPETGEIKIFSGEKEIISPDFGRIAAQTAKQVIIQKIREAERDVIYNEYAAKIGTITNGAVHRFEKGSIVVDLGKVEAILPKREQSPKEEYKQGDRIRAVILEVEKTSRGPQIILSRAHPDLVKKLFELEVPEIYEGIVQIKSCSREAGDRSKIAVYSKDEKVDAVGACVGMRGSRVKDIVRELQGEKIDIVRWSEKVGDYIGAALSPAKVSELKVNKETGKVEVVVEDDQLSLAIGKRGQNVRLAAKLTGFDIDIKSRSSLLAALEIPLTKLPGVGAKTKEALAEAGYKTVDQVAKSNLKELQKVKGVGKKTAEKMIEGAKQALKAAKPKAAPKAAKPKAAKPEEEKK